MPKIVDRFNCKDCEGVMSRTTFFAASAFVPSATGIVTSLSQTYPSKYKLAKKELNNSRSDGDSDDKIKKIIGKMDEYKKSELYLFFAYFIPLSVQYTLSFKFIFSSMSKSR